jgi:hypothetical protein
MKKNVLTEQITTSADNNQDALETLVIAQLAVIRRRETELQNRLQSNSRVEPATVAAEVRQLQNSADRLSRFLDAMTFGTSCAFAV